jgi:hypothetical protein
MRKESVASEALLNVGEEVDENSGSRSQDIAFLGSAKGAKVGNKAKPVDATKSPNNAGTYGQFLSSVNNQEEDRQWERRSTANQFDRDRIDAEEPEKKESMFWKRPKHNNSDSDSD